MGGAAGPDDALDDAREFGFPEEAIAELAAALGKSAAGEVAVWAENWDSVVAFCAIATQWRAAQISPGRLLYLGLDYGAARAGLELAGIDVSPAVWEDVRVMERTATIALNGGEG